MSFLFSFFRSRETAERTMNVRGEKAGSPYPSCDEISPIAFRFHLDPARINSLSRAPSYVGGKRLESCIPGNQNVSDQPFAFIAGGARSMISEILICARKMPWRHHNFPIKRQADPTMGDQQCDGWPRIPVKTRQVCRLPTCNCHAQVVIRHRVEFQKSDVKNIIGSFRSKRGNPVNLYFWIFQ